MWRGYRLFRETRLKPLARPGWAAWVCSLRFACPPRGFCLTAARLSEQTLSSRAFVQKAVAFGTRYRLSVGQARHFSPMATSTVPSGQIVGNACCRGAFVARYAT